MCAESGKHEDLFARSYEMADNVHSSFNVGIIAAAYSVPQSIETRFVESVKQALPSVSYTILVVDSTMASTRFSRGRLLNAGIAALQDKSAIIVCTDIDMLVPPNLVDFSHQEALESRAHVWVPCRNLDMPHGMEAPHYNEYDWKAMAELPLRLTGKGSWNAMLPELWSKVGGWNEEMRIWGAEDDDLHERCRRHGIGTMRFDSLPLVHVNHPSRWSADVKRESRRRNVRLLEQRDARNFIKEHKYTLRIIEGMQS